ncbi:12-hydroxyjasmonoyl-L-amino acid 12-hydroxylase [Salvia divinorum]|uniref:12-hydroxyjasmonoyl-L-amino acid 12-hydroxylase n=1 Tax=Salvia divinorum TaxID=28513 RepID=A0ABD1GRR3_SALDI
MESASSIVQYSHASWSWLPIISSLSFITSFMLLFLTVVRKRVWCDCEICESYSESRWRIQFHNLCDWYTHLLKNSPNRTVHIHVLNNTITANPENVEYMLKTRFDNFPKGKPFSAILGDFLGRGIFNVDGTFWRFQRKMASLELGRVSTRAYSFQVVSVEILQRLMPLLASAAEIVDLQEVFRRFSFDCISRLSFGLDPTELELSLPLSEFIASFDLASKLSAERALATSPMVWKAKRFLNIGSERRLRRAIRTIHVVARDFIRERRKVGFSDGQDLLSRFMSSVGDDDKFLVDIIVSFLLAGRDTVASALTSFFWLVACHPEVEAAILKEAEEVIGVDSAGCDQVKELHYLHAVVFEIMRLYPPIQFDSKYCVEDDVLPDGSFVKGGTRVTFHPYAMGRMEEIWGSDCLEFKPQRWIRHGVFVHENTFKCPIFQAGIRVCLGKELALMEIKTVAVSVLRRFRIELAQPDHPPRFSPGLTATFRDGLPARIRPRSSNYTNFN